VLERRDTANPILFVELDGNVFDLSHLTPEQKASYESAIKLLSASKLFAYYYDKLERSSMSYKVVINADLGKGGCYNANDRTVTFSSPNSYVVAQELFHAFQDDGDFYSPNEDHQNIECEGDLMSYYIVLDAGLMFGLFFPGEEHFYNSVATELDVPSQEVINSELCDRAFLETCEIRQKHFVDLYLNGDKSVRGYCAEPSNATPEAMKKVFKEANPELVGPRLPNGDYYSN
jgi:hypothetical protein